MLNAVLLATAPSFVDGADTPELARTKQEEMVSMFELEICISKRTLILGFARDMQGKFYLFSIGANGIPVQFRGSKRNPWNSYNMSLGTYGETATVKPGEYAVASFQYDNDTNELTIVGIMPNDVPNIEMATQMWDNMWNSYDIDVIDVCNAIGTGIIVNGAVHGSEYKTFIIITGNSGNYTPYFEINDLRMKKMVFDDKHPVVSGHLKR